jgi:F-type H+-transporting ATPase subunit b
MPQLDIATYTSQIFWLFICFSILVIVSIRFTLPSLSQILQERDEQIEGKKQASEHLKKKADEIHQEVEKNLAQARLKSHEEILKVSKELALKQEKIKREIALQYKERFNAAELDLARRKKEVFSELQGFSETLSLMIIQKTLELPKQERPVTQRALSSPNRHKKG